VPGRAAALKALIGARGSATFAFIHQWFNAACQTNTYMKYREI
jgi:hypothetical protein